LRQLARRDGTDAYGYEALLEPADLAQLPVDPLGFNAIGRDEPYDRVAGANEIGELLLPFFAVGQVASVDRDVEVVSLQGPDKRLRRGQVAAGVRNEQLELVG